MINHCNKVVMTLLLTTSISMFIFVYRSWKGARGHVPLCVGRSKGKAGIQISCIPEKKDMLYCNKGVLRGFLGFQEIPYLIAE